MTMLSILFMVAIGLAGIVIGFAFFGWFFTVQQQTVRIVQRLGAFNKVATAGFNLKVPFIDSVSAPVDLRVLQLDLKETVKTGDDVFVTIHASVLYKLDPTKVKEAYYQLSDPTGQITAHVANAIRAQVPNMTLSDVFKNQSSIAVYVKGELDSTMSGYGYIIESVLVPNAEPDAHVVSAMNQKMASEQAKVTAENTAQAAYTTKVRAAESEAKAMELHGQGIAAQRHAIVKGLQDSVAAFTQVQGVDASSAMQLVGLTQYMDMMRALAEGGQTKVVFVNSSPSGLADMEAGIRQAIASGNEAASAGTPVSNK